MEESQKLTELIEKPIASLSDDEALKHIGMLIDTAGDDRSALGTDRAFALLDEIQKRDLSPHRVVLTHYFAANAWDNRARQKSEYRVWAWEQPEIQEQILELRHAVRHEGFGQLPVIRKCQVLTNLANQLDRIGRFIEAIQYFDRALRLQNNFAMALGNRGIALGAYARTLYDDGHARLLMTAAHDSIAAALAPDSLYDSPEQESAQAAFKRRIAEILKYVDVDGVKKAIRLDEHSMGRGTNERAYRQWCLQHRLFINPLNDLGTVQIAATDILTLPSLTIKIFSGHVPPVIGFFNQMKQEFASARYLCYEGLHSDKPHFSDRGVLLYNTLDYPSHSLALEKVRAGFRIAYSLLDKIAFFLNSYLGLGHKPKQVSFKSVWYEPKGSDPRPMLKYFSSCQNWPLRGLFWLSKDIFEDEFQRTTEPKAEGLKEVREHLEHKYLQVHESWAGDYTTQPDQFGLHLGRAAFVDKTLHLLRLVRATLIYLSLAVHTEERQRHNFGDGLVVPMPLGTWDDEWKH
jgi:tetratricopeptide (TPR) repeat protein